jgi:ferredoxin--NADP+ reductase
VYRILEKQVLSDVTKLMVVEAPMWRARPGRDSSSSSALTSTASASPDHRRLRPGGRHHHPYLPGGRKSTKHLGTLNVGDALATLAGPLGHPTEIANYGTVVCVGGGVGIAPIFPIARSLKEAGNHVVSIIGARTRDLLFWEDRMRAVSDELIVCTDDGSYGRKALVTEPLKELLEARRKEIARVWAIGPAIMMKFVSLTTKPFGIPTIVSLNTIMIDGTGMCGGCRVLLEEGAQFVCVDGPEFDGHKVDWDNLLARLSFYRDEERLAMERWEHECRLEGVLKEQEATR